MKQPPSPNTEARYETIPQIRRGAESVIGAVVSVKCGAFCGFGAEMKYLICYQLNLFLACDVLLCSIFRGMFPHTLSSSWAGSENRFTRWTCLKLSILDVYLDWLGVEYPYSDKWPESCSHCDKWAFLIERNRAYFTTDGKRLFYGNPPYPVIVTQSRK